MNRKKKTVQLPLRDYCLDVYNLHWSTTKSGTLQYNNVLKCVSLLKENSTTESVSIQDFLSLKNQWLQKGLAKSTVNRLLSSLATVLNHAYRDGARSAPAPTKWRSKEPQGRMRVLSIQEEDILRRVDAEDHPMIHQQAVVQRAARLLTVFLLETGMRVGEVLSLTFDDFLNSDKSIKLKTSKNGDARVVPLTVDAQRMVRELLLLSKEVHMIYDRRSFLGRLGLTQSVYNHIWHAARGRMGLEADEEFVPHCLRHTCATKLVKAVALPVAQKWLGHKSLQMTARYSHISPSDLEDAATKMSSLSNAATAQR